jgi:hypothetical protein
MGSGTNEMQQARALEHRSEIETLFKEAGIEIEFLCSDEFYAILEDEARVDAWCTICEQEERTKNLIKRLDEKARPWNVK